jgi:hypothetical protein
MKTIAVCNYYDDLNKNNYMFENLNTSIGDNLLAPWSEFKKVALAASVTVATVDAIDLNTVDAFIFLDMPDNNNKYFKIALKSGKPLFLVIFECKLIRLENYDMKRHNYFKKIFTYDDCLVDNIKYFKINFAFSFPQEVNINLDHKEKLCSMIAGNKKSRHPLELYSKRIEAIRWFEKHHIDDFDLYGIGWDAYRFDGVKIVRALNRIKPLTRLFAEDFPSYRGKVERKLPIMQKYKFSICYENARDLPGYITEKIFDCFFAGCVPIYWGANNIIDHVPAECFIDKRLFVTYDELYKFMKNMPDEQYLNYLESAKNFLKSKAGCKFSTDCFARTLFREIISE